MICPVCGWETALDEEMQERCSHSRCESHGEVVRPGNSLAYRGP